MNKLAYKTIIISTGGTGGHVFPANQLAKSLKARGALVPAVTDIRGQTYLDKDSFDRVFQINLNQGNGMIGKIRQLVDVAIQTGRCIGLFRSVKPNMVVGFGGYMSLPPLLAAKIMSIPIVLHEENAVLGRVNRFMARFANAVSFGFEPNTPPSLPCPPSIIGNPVREDFQKLAHLERTDFSTHKIRLFVFGGSQGATILCERVPKAIELLPSEIQERLHIVMQIRQELMEKTCATLNKTKATIVEVAPFFNNLPQQLWEANLIISRAGAMTVTEIAVMGRAAVFIPLKIATDNHQFHNVAKIVEHKAAWMLTEKEFTPEALAATLQEMIADEIDRTASTTSPKRSETIRSYGDANASNRLVKICEDLLN